MSFIANVASKAGRICIRIETEVNLALSLDSRTVFFYYFSYSCED